MRKDSGLKTFLLLGLFFSTGCSTNFLSFGRGNSDTNDCPNLLTGIGAADAIGIIIHQKLEPGIYLLPQWDYIPVFGPKKERTVLPSYVDPGYVLLGMLSPERTIFVDPQKRFIMVSPGFPSQNKR